MGESGRLPFLKPADQVDIQTGNYEREVATAILVNEDGQVLLQLRDDFPTIPYPGHWAMLGGGVEAEETSEIALRRELLEEIGFVAADLLPYGKVISPQRVLVTVYVGRIDRRTDELMLNEGQAVRYFHQDELPGLQIIPYHKEVLFYFFSGGHS